MGGRAGLTAGADISAGLAVEMRLFGAGSFPTRALAVAGFELADSGAAFW